MKKEQYIHSHYGFGYEKVQQTQVVWYPLGQQWRSLAKNWNCKFPKRQRNNEFVNEKKCKLALQMERNVNWSWKILHAKKLPKIKHDEIGKSCYTDTRAKWWMKQQTL